MYISAMSDSNTNVSADLVDILSIIINLRIIFFYLATILQMYPLLRKNPLPSSGVKVVG